MKPFLALIFAMAAFAGRSQAQAQPQQSCMKLKKVWTSADAVPQGQQISFLLEFEADHCTTPVPADAASAPVLLVEEQPGLKVAHSSTSYEKTSHPKQGEREQARRMIHFVRFATTPELPQGEHKIAATLAYNVVDQHGKISVEQLPFEIKLNVVAPGTAVKQHPERSPWVTVGETALVAPVMIALLPLMLLASLVEFFRSGHFGWDC